MAEAPPPQSDRDLASIAEARALARRAKQALVELAEFSQERIERVNYRTIDKQSLFVFHDVCFSCD